MPRVTNSYSATHILIPSFKIPRFLPDSTFRAGPTWGFPLTSRHPFFFVLAIIDTVRRCTRTCHGGVRVWPFVDVHHRGHSQTRARRSPYELYRFNYFSVCNGLGFEQNFSAIPASCAATAASTGQHAYNSLLQSSPFLHSTYIETPH